MPKYRVQLSCSEDASCRQFNTISSDKLSRLIGRPDCPALIDVQTDEDFAADPRLIPGAVRRPFDTVANGQPSSRGDPPSSSARRG